MILTMVFHRTFIFHHGLSSDDTSLFSVVYNANTTAKALDNYLIKISRWAYQWKMWFTPEPSKQTQEVIFTRKTKTEHHLPLAFNNNNVSETNSKKTFRCCSR